MKCVTLAKFEEWLLPFNVRVDENRNLLFAHGFESIMSIVPKTSGSLLAFARELVEWLPYNMARMVYLSHWETYPPDNAIIFEMLREGCGESRRIIEAPGHSFDGLPPGNRYELDEIPYLSENPIIQESAIMAGVVFLTISFNWYGYIIGEGCTDHIYLGDEFIVFKSSNVTKLDQTRHILAKHNLKIVDKMEDAWMK